MNQNDRIINEDGTAFNGNHAPLFFGPAIIALFLIIFCL